MADEPQAQSTPVLSVEGERLAGRVADYDTLVSIMSNQYSVARSKGLINFGLAENTLMHDDLREFLPRNFHLTDCDFSYGDHLLGSNRLFAALAKLFNQKFNPVILVEPKHILTGTGLTTVLEQMTVMLCNPGDVFLIARPYYNGFDGDLTIRAKAEVVGVDVGLDFAAPTTLDAFEEQVRLLTQAGKKARAVMLCNPNNPLGFNYPRATLVAYAAFCEKHNLHLVSDEIYALSQFHNAEASDKERVGFTSMLSVDVMEEAKCNPARVHVLYGVAKDFGMNGLRIGCVVTQHNPQLYQAFYGLGLQMKVSSVADSLWSALLNDEKTLDSFISTNQQRLAQSFASCQAFFKKNDIPYLGQPVAALFFWINLSRFHREKDDEGQVLDTALAKDRDLQQAFAAGGIFIAAGDAFHGTDPGWFRFTFAVRQDYLDVGFERFEAVLQKRTLEAQV